MRQTTALCAAAIAGLFSGAAAAQPDSSAWKTCTGDTDRDSVIISSCSAVVASAREPAAHKAIAHKNMCLAYNDGGDHDRAIRECDEAIRIDPENAETFVFRGHALFNKNDFDRAILDYDQAIALGSKAATTLVQRAAAYHRKGDEARAIADLDAAITLNPRDPVAFYIRGAAYQKSGMPDRTLQDFTEALKLAPNYAEIRYRRGLLRKQMGDMGGDDDIKAARQVDPRLGR